ncbi:hypothetical protein ACFTQ7_07840 [Lysinibacillus sp. NPDC056959]|uniref:hypothetical protein n=1 Tax=Lysinibacillus sp. NPDC056959 TaxID=3345981 RepID=UPI00362C47FF
MKGLIGAGPIGLAAAAHLVEQNPYIDSYKFQRSSGKVDNSVCCLPLFEIIFLKEV